MRLQGNRERERRERERERGREKERDREREGGKEGGRGSLGRETFMFFAFQKRTDEVEQLVVEKRERRRRKVVNDDKSVLNPSIWS